MSTLESRIQYLEDLEAIRYLKHYYYCHCLDRTVAGDSAAIEQTISRFTDDIIADFTGLPLARGIDEVSMFLGDGLPAFMSWSQHRVMNEVIDIDGDSARALWYLDCPVVFREGNPMSALGAGFMSGRYEEDYVREDGQWKWRKIVALFDVQAEFATNWSRSKQLFKNR